MPLADYLANKYLSADQKPKKRKRKNGAKSEGLKIAEDDVNDWTKPKGDGDEDDDAPTMVGNSLAGGLNMPAKKSTWLKVGASAPTDSEQAAADAILTEAQADAARHAEPDEEAPAIVDDDGETEGLTMASGAMAGLQTAAQVTAALKRKAKADRKAMEDAGVDATGKAQETIYRDASGRIINVAMKRAELRAKAEEEERKKQEEIESRKGDVQRREQEERKRDLQEVKVMGVARHADDKTLNDELRERGRWNDPMAQMLTTKKSGSGKSGKSGKSGGKTYQGAFEPNRYGIRPGWRWDGVDRGNGFERKWFAARNAKSDRAAMEYAWTTDE
ncbi:hypothetical protein LTR08_001404 [Meristemomyces frigidus]|nr:hypothetical protein LTR08_001404 [Meristemomyces frigidus]